MRKLILVALLGLSSSMAFADVQVFESADTKATNFACRFGDGKGTLRCEARVAVELPTVAATDERDRNNASIAIRCNDGLEFLDRHAKYELDRERDSFTVCGKDDGREVRLAIFDDRDDRREDRTFHARLSWGKDKGSLRGSCVLVRE